MTTARRIIDLTLPLYSGMPVYPGDPEASIELVQILERDGWNMRRLGINSHDGTHVNVPAHMVAGGRTLDDYAPDDFCGPARIFADDEAMTPALGYLFRDRNIDAALCEKIIQARPRFVGLSRDYAFEVEIQRHLLKAGILVFENLANLERLPPGFDFYGLPLKIRGGDGSPVRAFAVVG